MKAVLSRDIKIEVKHDVVKPHVKKAYEVLKTVKPAIDTIEMNKSGKIARLPILTCIDNGKIKMSERLTIDIDKEKNYHCVVTNLGKIYIIVNDHKIEGKINLDSYPVISIEDFNSLCYIIEKEASLLIGDDIEVNDKLHAELNAILKSIVYEPKYDMLFYIQNNEIQQCSGYEISLIREGGIIYIDYDIHNEKVIISTTRQSTKTPYEIKTLNVGEALNADDYKRIREILNSAG